MKWFMVSFARLSRVVASISVAALLGVQVVPAHAITYDLVTVGNAGNANDSATGNLYGGVAYDYAIGTYDVTIGQYTDFLNAVAATDTYSLCNASMATVSPSQAGLTPHSQRDSNATEVGRHHGPPAISITEHRCVSRRA